MFPWSLAAVIVHRIQHLIWLFGLGLLLTQFGFGGAAHAMPDTPGDGELAYFLQENISDAVMVPLVATQNTDAGPICRKPISQTPVVADLVHGETGDHEAQPASSATQTLLPHGVPLIQVSSKPPNGVNEPLLRPPARQV